MKPLLKYAGGKGWLVDYLRPGIIAHLTVSGGTYCEPFLGGGAMAFALAGYIRVPGIAPWMYLSDASEPLIYFYQKLAEDPARVYEELGILLRVYEQSGYYRLRDRFNEGGFLPFQRAAAFLYLNKLGYNGLWRVNADGCMNVPVGDYTFDPANPLAKFPSLSDLIDAAQHLRGATIDCIPFEPVISRLQCGDVGFFDPPYEGGFDGYIVGGFPEELHALLATQLCEAAERGVAVFCTVNEKSRARYEGGPFTLIDTLEARMVNSKGSGRGAVRCLLVVSRGYEGLVTAKGRAPAQAVAP